MYITQNFNAKFGIEHMRKVLAWNEEVPVAPCADSNGGSIGYL